MDTTDRGRFATLKGERGMFFTELMASVVILGIFTLGLITILMAQAKQRARDKVLNDMYVYAQEILNEAETSLGGAVDFDRSAVSGGRASEELEFEFTGTVNMGRTLDTRFTKEGERKLVVRQNQTQLPWSRRFPPPELDPDRNTDPRFRVHVSSFRFLSYNDRQFLNPRVGNILVEAVLQLQLEDKRDDYTIDRVFRRVIAVPNKHISESRAQQSTGA